MPTIRDSKARRVTVREVPLARPSNQFSDHYPRLVYLPDAAEVLSTGDAGELAVLERIKEIVGWTQWPDMSQAFPHAAAGLVLGFPHNGSFVPHLPLQENVNIKALHFLAYVRSYRLALRIHNLRDHDGSLYEMTPNLLGPDVNADFVFGLEDDPDTYYTVLGDVFWQQYGLAFRNTDAYTVSPMMGLTYGNGVVLRDDRKFEPVREILVIAGHPDGLDIRAFRLEAAE